MVIWNRQIKERAKLMNISLTPKLEAMVKEQVASGFYGSASEVMREALRLLFDKNTYQKEKNSHETTPDKGGVMKSLKALEPQLRKQGVSSLSLFGSLIHGNARPDSDIDVLVDFDENRRLSLVDFVEIKSFLEERLGRDVDVVSRLGIESALRDTVLSEAENVF